MGAEGRASGPTTESPANATVSADARRLLQGRRPRVIDRQTSKENLVISFSHDFIFVHVPKTGGNSLQHILRQYSDARIVNTRRHHDGHERFALQQIVGDTMLQKHSTIREYEAAVTNDFFSSAIKFSVSRNPYSRAISLYFFRKQKTSFQLPVERRESDFDSDDFGEMLKAIRPLEYFLCGDPAADVPLLEAAKVDVIMRHDRLQGDFDALMDRLHLQRALLPVHNRSRHDSFAGYYTPHLRRIAANRFRREIEAFGYQCEDDAPVATA